MRIVLKNLKKTYPVNAEGGGTVTAVNGISLDIGDNTIFGVIGKSGAGKSSLVRLMGLLETPDEGEVYYNGERVDNLKGKDLIARRRKVGMIFQNFNLFSSRTSERNVAYPLEIAGTPKSRIRERVAEMLSLVGLSDKAASPISALSGGQKQRVAIARALAPNPDVLFCDEATSALDPQTTHSILDLIRDIQKKIGLTVVMITHQMEVVRDACERVAVIDAGALIEQGTVEEVFNRPRAALTREFMRMMSPDTQKITRWSREGGAYVLRFVGEKTGEPVLSGLAKKFDVDFNIRAGGTQKIKDNEVGALLVDFIGDDAEIRRAILYLNGLGVSVEHSDGSI